METARAFKAFGEAGAIDIPPQAHAAMRELFRGFSASEAETSRTMLSTLNETGQLIDPHTADGVKVALEHLEDGVPMLVLETALPAKFAETIIEAIGEAPEVPDALRDLDRLPQRVEVMDCDARLVADYMRRHAL